MKIYHVFPVMLTVVLGQYSRQFSFFGNTPGKITSNIQSKVDALTNGLKYVPEVLNVQNFEDFVSQTGKMYASETEKKLREGLFKARKIFIDNNNAAFSAGLSTYKLAVNAFSDLTNTEFLKQLTGIKKSSAGEEKAKKHRKISASSATTHIPKSLDWRQKGGVTPVKFQHECGSCWSFAVTGAIEGHIFRKTGKLMNFSEQYLIDCGKEEFGLFGCDGGFQEYGFEFVTSPNSIASSVKYPYIGKKNGCNYTEPLKDVEIKGFATIPFSDEKTMMEVLVTSGPLACSVKVLESLLMYQEGIYNDAECNKGEVNHAVLVIGYDRENNQDFWIVKNSWDSSWGEKGYFRLPRGKNFCGIATECSYPLV